MKQTLQLKLSQHLTLTPQLQQSIRLLQLSTLELQQEIEKFLQENPLLEREEDEAATAMFTPADDTLASSTAEPSATTAEADGQTAFDESASSADWQNDFGAASPRSTDDDGDYQDIQEESRSLHDHLNEQLAMIRLSERDRSLVRFLIEAIDDDGYLTQSLEELLEILPAELVVDIEDLRIALHHVQNFEPTGIGARNPQECLSLQLESLPPSPALTLAADIVHKHLDQLAAHDFSRLKKNLLCSDEELRAAHALILSLNPRPGARFGASDTRYIVPDVVVRKLRGAWVTSLNRDAMPRLRVNRLYADILQKQRGASSNPANLSGQLQEARWLIKNVQQRFDTILRVSQAIVERQRQFLEYGEVAMRPLILREISEQLGLHESTVSRVTTQKYMATPRGIFELKYFFGSHVATDTGGACSATAIRALIRQLVAAEDGHKPLPDSKIAEILGQQGIVVARRTIAKYREALNIPPVNLRKSI